jgi:hypothetical protein
VPDCLVAVIYRPRPGKAPEGPCRSTTPSRPQGSA